MTAAATNLRLHLVVLLIVIVAQAIGTRMIGIGSGSILFLPLLYSFVLGLILNPAVSGGRLRLLRIAESRAAAPLLVVAILPFLAKLGTLIGPELDTVLAAGPALFMSEFGHLATILIAFPVALALGLRREAVGATFSIDREPNLAVISERYGLRGPEGAGVLGVYVCGTLFGTVVFSVMAPFVASLGIFSRDALAIGCGVGSGSMTAACSAGLAEQLGGDTDALLALAGASNLLTTAIGVLFALYIALPLVEAMYRLLVRGGPSAAAGPALPGDAAGATPAAAGARVAGAARDAGEPSSAAAGEEERGEQPEPEAPALGLPEYALLAAIVLAIALVGNAIDPGVPVWDAVPGALILLAIAVIGVAGTRLIGRIPAIVWISIVAIVVTVPAFPGSEWISGRLEEVDFLALATPVLAYAGIAVTSREVAVFKRSGWRIAIVAVLVFAGSFLGAAAVADLFLLL